MRHLKTTLAVLGAATILVLAGNTISLAATGHAFILGKANTASTITKLTRTTSGPALNLTTKKTTNPPFSTNAKGKVTNLNADSLDGLDSSALMGVRSKVFRYTWATLAGGHTQALPTLAPGVYLATLEVPMLGAQGDDTTSSWQYCRLEQSGTLISTTDHGTVQSSSSNSAAAPFLSSATVLSTANGNHVTLACQASKTWNNNSGFPAEVTLTKLDGATVAGTVASSGRTMPGARAIG